MQSWKLQLFGFLSGGWQYRWAGLAIAWLVCLAGWIAVGFLPDVYQSSAKVYIDTDTLMRPLLKGIVVTTNTQQQISIMLRTLMTSPNLERIVRATRPDAEKMSAPQMQDAVAKLRSKISLSGAGTKNLYQIGFADRDPAYAQNVAQTLVSVMVDSNAGDLRRESDDARSFLDQQIAQYERRIQEADKRKAAFRAAHMNVFFGSSDVDEAKTAILQAQQQIDEIGARRNSLAGQLGATPSTIDLNGPAPVSLGGAGTVESKRQQLGHARAKLDDLRARYTEDYPDVVAQKMLVERLKAQVSQKADPREDPGLQSVSNPAYLMLRTKLADEEVNLAVARGKLAAAQKRLDEAGKNVGENLLIKRQYESLDRDYLTLKKNYETLVERREAANISQAAGDQQSSVVFRVIDPPSLPNRPSAPNRLLLNFAVFAAGLGAGLAAAIGLGAISGRFRSVEQLSEAFALPVLGTVTVARTAADVMRLRLTLSYFVAGGSALLGAYAVVLLLFHTTVQSSGGGLL